MSSKKFQSNLKKKLILGTAQFGYPMALIILKKKELILEISIKYLNFILKII